MEKYFEENEIVLHLKKRNSPFYNKILDVYDISDNILKEIPKTFSNYTLHDINHSIRVIDYMTKFIKKRFKAFSELELAMIVYVGLLHDVGMFVSDNEYEQLIEKFGKQSGLFKNYSLKEKNTYLQNHIRDEHGRRVQKILSQEYIVGANISSLFRVGQAYSVADIVAKICQSHTEDCEWIVNNLDEKCSFGNYDIHPQYIAFLLRIGDALDIDDRRAPWLLYNLLNPEGSSSDEWKKHIPITNYDKVTLEKGKYIITFAGESREPKTYRKVMEYINWFDGELVKIAMLVKNYEEPYTLNLKLPIVNTVKSKGFIISDLKFNLNYEHIVTLLMGENIYGSKKDGLREILQNAIDAALLMDNIYKRRRRLDFRPLVRVEMDKEQNRIVVYDNGTGMSSDILRKYFFNIGNSYYTSKEFKEGLYDYKPIGHFGIGFLACFMLSSIVTLETKYFETGETQRINFEKNSPHVIFIDCKSNEFLGEHGTRIILKYDQIIGDIFESEDELIEHIKELLLTINYQCQIVKDGEIYPLEIPFKNSDCVVMSNSEVDIVFKLKKIPDIVTDCRQLIEIDKDAFFVVNKDYDEEGVGIDYLYEQAEELDNMRNASPELFVESLKHYCGVYEAGDDEANIIEKYSESDYYEFWDYEILLNLFLKSEAPLWESLDTEILQTVQKMILNNSYNGEYIYWYDVPYIADKDILANFLSYEGKYGYEQAMERYEHGIKHFSVLGTDELSNELCFELSNEILLWKEEKKIADYSYFEQPLFKPLLRKQEVIKHLTAEEYLPITHNYNFRKNNVKCKVYMKGIWVHKVDITLPHMILGTRIEQIYINIKSNQYETNVARSELSNSSVEMLCKNIAIAIYNWRLDNEMISETEKELIGDFLQKYYE